MSEKDLTIQFEDGVQQWDYITFIIANTELEPALKTLGRDGWELTQGFPCQVAVGEQQQQSTIALPGGMPARPTAAGGMMLIFKRPMAALRDRGGEAVQPSVN